ncbi:hypothetical protein SAMN05421548_101585 [Paraburkholderia lycopersici]|uniref:Uncharacterized protein n=1 Tax=Paraburkholderia lycopersici TaxID=416944 RepID=A0A1G6H2I3_9BURK|nr:hypothetical protein SAMN05421548_101585 [Paraburkholderia lycopersici]
MRKPRNILSREQLLQLAASDVIGYAKFVKGDADSGHRRLRIIEQHAHYGGIEGIYGKRVLQKGARKRARRRDAPGWRTTDAGQWLTQIVIHRSKSSNGTSRHSAGDACPTFGLGITLDTLSSVDADTGLSDMRRPSCIEPASPRYVPNVKTKPFGNAGWRESAGRAVNSSKGSLQDCSNSIGCAVLRATNGKSKVEKSARGAGVLHALTRRPPDAIYWRTV